MWNRMVENLPSVLEHFLAGCSSCFVEFLAALEALSFALGVACSALGVAYLTTKSVQKFHSLSTIQAVMQNQQIFFFFLDAVEFLESSSPLLPVVSLHEYTGLLKNNNIYSQNLLSQKTTVLKYNAISSFAVVA